MKKIYMIPTMQVVKIQTAQMLAGSPQLNGTYEGGTVLSRQYDWDNEE